METTELLLGIFAIIILFAMLFIWQGCKIGKRVSDLYDETHESEMDMFTPQSVNEKTEALQKAIDESNEINLPIPKKRKSRSRRADFSMEQAIKDGKAILVNGQSHRTMTYLNRIDNEYLSNSFIFGENKYGKIEGEFRCKRWVGSNGIFSNGAYLVNIKTK